MQKRGQITTFIILGVVLLAIVAFFIYLRGQQKALPSEEKITLPGDVGAVQTFTQECLDKVAKDAVRIIGASGGYYRSYPKLMWVEGVPRVPYLFEGLVYDVPTKEFVEKELGLYVNDFLKDCTKNFENFKGISVEQGEISTNVSIDNKKVFFRSNIPLKITKDGEVGELNSFNTEVAVDLLRMLKAAKEYMDIQKAFPNEFAHGALLNSGIENNLTIETINGEVPYHFDSFMINFFDNTAKEEDKVTYVFSFGVQFTWSNATPESAPLRVENIPDQIAVVGKPFTYKLNASGEGIRYEDNTELFDVKSDGTISFIPGPEDEGIYYIVITATDKYGNVDFASMTLDVLGENTPPVIEPIPEQRATVNNLFTLQINASDKETDFLEYGVENPVGDMSIGYDGVFSWTPTEAGQKTVNINVSDGRLTTKASFKITVQ